MWTAKLILTGASYGSSGGLTDRENSIFFHLSSPAGGKYSGTNSRSPVYQESSPIEGGLWVLRVDEVKSPGTMTLSSDALSALTANH